MSARWHTGSWLLVVLGLVGVGGVRGQENLPPVHPTWVRPDQIPALLEQSRQGVWVQLPREEWDQLWARVQALPAPVPPPRLLKARYWAELAGTQGNTPGKREELVPALTGRGDWTILHSGPGPAWLPLAGLHLALQNVKLEGAPALLGVWPGRGLGLWLEKTGLQTVTFDWSLRGAPGVGEMAFDVQVPACPQNTLEVTLPAEYLLTIPHKTALLHGPEFAGQPGHRLWRMSFAGRSQLSLVLRPNKGPGALRPLLLTSVISRQQFYPDRLAAEFKIQVEVVHGPVPKLVFNLDPQLQVREVTCPGLPLHHWEVIPPSKDKKDSPPQLVVSWVEPVRGQLPPLRLLAEAPIAADGSWRSPGIWLPSAVFRGEVLELHLPGDWELSDWSAGDFRLLDSQREEEGRWRLRLVAEAGVATAPARPHARGRPAPVTVALRQDSLCELDPTGWRLTADLTCTVQQGRLFHLEIALPTGDYKYWQVEKVECKPSGWLRSWATTTVGGTPTLFLDLAQALTAGQQAHFHLVLRRTPPTGRQEWEIPFPQLLPRTTGPVSGTWTLHLSPHYQLMELAAPPAHTTLTTGTEKGQYLQIFYEYRGKPPQGRLRLRLQMPRLQVWCRNDVVLTAGRAHLQCQLQLEPLLGTLQDVVLYLTAPPPAYWHLPAVRNEETPQIEPWPLGKTLPALLGLAGGPLPPLGAWAGQPAGSYWRLRWPEPVTRRRVITLTAFWPQAAHPLATGENDWAVPLLTVPTAERLQGEVNVHLHGATPTAFRAHGLHAQNGPALPAAPASRPERPPLSGAEIGRSFTFSLPASCRLPELHLRSRPTSAPEPAPESCDLAEWCTTVYPDGRLVHLFRFQMRGWRRRTLPLRLPAGSQLLSVHCNGYRLLSPELQERPEGLILDLPANNEAAVQQFEVRYATTWSAPFWQPWWRLTTPPPELPLAPLGVRRRWQLPPGWIPLADTWQCVPVSADHSRDSWAWLRQLWFLGDAPLRVMRLPMNQGEPIDHWRQLLADADAALRQQLHPGQPLSLGQLLEQLLHQHLQDRVPLLIDRLALEQAGLGPETLLPTTPATKPLWERLGLVLLPTPRAIVVTSPSVGRRWQMTSAASLPGDLLEALDQAATAGQDASTRFQDLANWQLLSGHREAATPYSRERASKNDNKDIFHPYWLKADWTTWEAIAGAPPAEELWVISQSFCSAAGLALAIVLGLTGGLLGSRWRMRGRLRLLLVWLGLGGLALIWAPHACEPALFWPLATGVLLAGWWYLRPSSEQAKGSESSDSTGSGSRPDPPAVGSSSRRSAPRLLFLFLLAVASLELTEGVDGHIPLSLVSDVFSQEPARPAAPPAETIYLLPGPAQAPERQQVLVRPAFLRQLQARLQPAAPPVQALLLSAHYQGLVQEQRADCQADFLFYCPVEHSRIILPLRGVNLKEGTLLNGAPAYPLPNGEQEYVLPVPGQAGKLVHLRVPFRVSVQSLGEAREVRFGVPTAAQASLTLLLPPGARRPQVITALGRQEAAAGNQLHADLGLADLGQPAGTSAVQIRWQQPGPARPASSVRLREYYFWDLRPGLPSERQPLPTTPALTAVLQYALGNNTISHLLLELPDDLEVRSLEATPALPLTALSHRLKSWQLQPAGKGKRRLLVEWSGPMSGDLQLTLGLVPRRTLGSGPLSLVLPISIFPSVIYEKSPAGLLAYRTDGRETADRPQHLGAINIPAAQFLKEWEGLGLRTFTPGEGEKILLRAYRFRRTRPEALLELVPLPSRSQGDWQLAWHFTPTHADWQAVARLPAGHSATLLEWDLPEALTLSQVTGASVQHWNRQGNRLFIWLRPGQEPARVELTGWFLSPPPGRRFALPALRWLSPSPSTADLTLTAAPGLSLDVTHLHNLLPLAQEGPLTFTLLNPTQPYTLQVQAQPVPVEAPAQTLTLLEAQEGWLQVTTYLRLARPIASPQPIQLHLQHKPGVVLRVDAPGLLLEEDSHDPQTWQARLRFLPGTLPYFQVKIYGKYQIQGTEPFVVPRLTVRGAQLQGRWLALLGDNFQVQRQQGLTPLTNAAPELAPWPLAAHLVRQQGQAWKINDDSWQLVLRPRPAAAGPAVRLFLAEEHLFLAGQTRWLHETRLLLMASAHAQLPVHLPVGARCLAAAVDGRPVPLPTSGNALQLPLSPQPGWHMVRLWWYFESGQEALSRPRLEHPVSDKSDNYPLLWNVYVPAGYHLRHMPAAVPAILPAERDTLRATVYLQLVQQVGKQTATKSEESLSRSWFLHQIRQYLHKAESERLTEQAAARLLRDAGKEDRLHALQTRQRQLQRQLEALRPDLAHAVPTSPGVAHSMPPARETNMLFAIDQELPAGLPCSWEGRATQPPPRLFLEPDTALSQHRRLLASELLLGFLLAAWILSHLGRLLSGWRRFWPEQLLLGTLAAEYVLGPSLLGHLLLLFASLSRLIFLGRWLWRRGQARTPSATAASS